MDHLAPSEPQAMNHWHHLLRLLLAGLASSSQAEPAIPGRLFLTSSQRLELDRQRHAHPATLAELPAGATSLTLNGEVRRSSGRNMRWINGAADWRAQPRLAISVGDTVHADSGASTSPLGNGRITVTPAHTP